MRWIYKKKNQKRKAALAFGMAGILMCSALNPVLASDEWIDEPVIMSFDETGDSGGSIDAESASELEIQSAEIEEFPFAEIEDIAPEAAEIQPNVTEDVIAEEAEILPVDIGSDITEEVQPEDMGDSISEEEMVQQEETDDAFLEELEIVDEAVVMMDDAELLAVQAAVSTAAESGSVTAPDLLGSIGTKNQWQIVAEGYSGREQSSKKGYDIDKDGSNDIFYQKNVVSTDIENEFRVYLGVTKRMTWDELLAECDFAVTTAKKYKTEGQLVPENDIKGNSGIISPGMGAGTLNDRNYQATVTFTRGGKTVHTYTGWYHGPTPNCSNGTGFIMMPTIGKALAASIGVNLHEGSNGTGGTLDYVINLDTMASQNIHFSVEDIVVDSVKDTMGDFITYEGVEHSDGSCTYDDAARMLTWTPESNGVTGVQVTENGGLTGYHYNIHQLVYKAQLNVEKADFRSCAQKMNSTVNDPESCQVNQQAILSCHIGTNGSGQVAMQVPYVRGLLYDLEFQKVVEESKITLEGIRFTVTRKAGGSTYAEQLSYTAEEVTGSDGWIKFHNLPWGEYTITETAYQEGNDFQNNYLDQTLPKEIAAVSIGQILNGSALTDEHQNIHGCDRTEDLSNKLFVYYNSKAKNAPIVENTPYRAKVTIQKIVNEYDSLSVELQASEYKMQINSEDIYIKPASDSKQAEYLQKEAALKHQDTVTYDLLVPKNGGTLNLSEVIPDTMKNKIVFGGVQVTAHTDSTAFGTCTEQEQGCILTVLPGNDITITVTNIPVGKIYIQKEISNYRTELANDEFVIQAVSADGGTLVNTQVVLKHGQTSAPILIKQTATINLTEILPKEYTLSGIRLSGGGTLQGSQITVQPGEEVTVTLSNTYSGKSFFHVSKAMTNIFQ